MNHASHLKKKYTKKDTFCLPSTNNKSDSDKKNPDIADLQVEIMPPKEFVLSDICLLNNEIEALSPSKYVSMGNNNPSDPSNAVANERLLKKLEKENSFWREDLQNENIIFKTLIENITDLNKKKLLKVSLIINRYRKFKQRCRYEVLQRQKMFNKQIKLLKRSK